VNNALPDSACLSAAAARSGELNPASTFFKGPKAWFPLICVGGLFLLSACGPASQRNAENATVTNGVQYLGKIKKRVIHESSGVVASRRYPNVFWTHNDGGKRNLDTLFAITRTGTFIGEWRVMGARLADWEDITVDKNGDLLLADTGDNHARRRHVMIHRVKEPNPAERKGTATIEHTWVLSYPNGPRNAEAFFVLGNFGYLISKQSGQSAEVFRFALSPNGGTNTLECIAELNITSPVCGAALSPDAKVLGLVSHAGAHAYRIEGDLSRLQGLAPYHLTPFPNLLVEGCTFVSDGLLATSETRHMYLFTNEVFQAATDGKAGSSD
jgi:hypothetical protein